MAEAPTVLGVAGFGYSLVATPATGSAITFNNITEITPPPAAVSEAQGEDRLGHERRH